MPCVYVKDIVDIQYWSGSSVDLLWVIYWCLFAAAIYLCE